LNTPADNFDKTASLPFVSHTETTVQFTSCS